MAGIYKVASPQITSEIIEGEVMIINLENGRYYNMEAVGAEVWQAVVEGNSLQNILNRIQSRFEGEEKTIRISVETFLKEMQEEGLISFEEISEGTTNPSKITNLSQIKSPFSTPVLNKFTDMQELLLLDPIHEVDEAGWPRAKQNY